MKKPFNLRLALFLAISLIVGIVFGYLLLVESIVIAVLVLVSYFTAIIFFLVKKSGEITFKMRLGIVIALGVFLLVGLSAFTIQTQSFINADLDNHYYQVEGVVEKSYETEWGIYAVVDDVTVKGETNGKLYYKVGVYINGDNLTSVDMGRRIRFSAKLNDYEVTYQDNFSSYNVSARVKYRASVSSSLVEILDFTPTIFQSVNLFIRNTLKSGLSTQSFSIAYALITGHDEFIDADVLTNFRSTGIAHVFAVSGLHIGFIATVLKFILDKLKVNKWATVFIIAPILLFYSGVCGFSSSSIRATIMCVVALTTANAGLKYDPLSSVSISAILVLLINPCELFCVGFQLSFSVVLGIILLSKPIAKILKFLPEKFAQSLAVVLSAQIASTPIMLIAFGNVSLISVACNLIFVPVVGVIYVVTIILTLLGGIFGIPSITLFVIDLVFKAIVFLITLLDYTIFTAGGVSLGFSVLFYFVAIIVSAGLFNIKKKLKTIVSVCLISVFLITAICNTFYTAWQPTAYLSGVENLSFCYITFQGENTLVLNDFDEKVSVYNLQRVVNESGQKRIDNLIIPKSQGNDDIQHILTKVNSVAEVKSIYYFGEKRVEEEKAIELSFGVKVKTTNISQDQTLTLKSISIKFVLGGYGVSANVNGKNLLLLSRFGNDFTSQKLDGEYFLAVAVDYQERVMSRVNSNTKLSYLINSLYKSAEEQGFITLALV